NVFIQNNQSNCISEMAIINDCTNINGPADLELSLNALSTNVLFIYEFYDFELTLTNNGEGSVTDPIVDFPVPSGFAFTSSTPSFNGFFGYDNWLGEWRVEGTLLAGESTTLQVRFFSLTESAPIDLYAQIGQSNKSDPDSTPGNGTCCMPIEDDEVALTLLPEGMLLQEADLELTGTIDQTEVSEGDTVTVNLTITNHGPDPASAVRVQYAGSTPNQAALVFSTITPSRGNAFLTPFWFLGDMQVGISETLTVQYVIGSSEVPFNLLFEVSESIPDDPDSTPGNAVGGLASEDDEVSFTLLPSGFSDTAPPVPTLTTPITLVNGAFTVSINFDEMVTGLTLSDFTIDNGVLSNLFGSGAAYSLTVQPDSEGLVNLGLPAGAVLDAAGNANVASNVLQVTFVEPGTSVGPDLALSLTANVNSAAIYSNVIYTLTLSNEGIARANNILIDIPYPVDLAYVADEAMSGNFDVFLRNWSIPSLGAGEVATLELTLFTLVAESVPTTLYAQVSQASPEDDDSTPGNWTCVPQGVLGCIPSEDDEASLTINVEQAQANPTVMLSTNSATVMGDFEVNVNFSTAINGLEASDFSVSNGTVNGLLGAGSEYTLSISPNLPGNLTIALPANRVVDINGNGNLASNQLVIEFVAPPGNETDLELNFSTTETGFVIYDFVTLTLTVSNTSGVDAANVVVAYPKPENTAFSDQIISAGTYSDFSGEWIIGNIPAGTSEVLEVTWFTLDDTDPIVAYAQVASTLPDDTDSSPNNGTCCLPLEDDEAVISIEPGTQLRAARVMERTSPTVSERLKMLAPYPNPAIDRLILTFYVSQKRSLQIRLTNAFGEEVFRDVLELEEGLVERSVDLSTLPGGIYYLSTDLEGKHRPVPIVKIQP
ncbi:MAG: Ig-like domain-containing protein, partial [Bacteroidota bacterium]